VPTLNEQGNIPFLVERLHKALSKKFKEYEVVFVDDHSTDNTIQLIELLAEEYPIRVHLKQGAKGKAQSFLEGFDHAKHDIIATIDADLQYAPEEIPTMVEKL